MEEIVIHWFRRDLRAQDNRALAEAAAAGLPVVGLFIFDTGILSPLKRDDGRVSFIHEAVLQLSKNMQGTLLVEHGTPIEVFTKLVERFKVKAVYINEDYEPSAKIRDKAISDFLAQKGIELKSFTDQLIFAPSDSVKKDGEPYKVFTPFANYWRKRLRPADFKAIKVPPLRSLDQRFRPLSLEEIGFTPASHPDVQFRFRKKTLETYEHERNRPDLDTTTRIGPHLRFGTISVRQAVAAAQEFPVWLNELIWREFFMVILNYFPHTVEEPARNPNLKWRRSRRDFELWAQGKTGYPFVDAGMRQLNQIGYMHNRARLVTASFLCKHLMLPWKWGELYFAERLFDYEQSNNVGNWQWSAGTGFDAAPYFRIFNPIAQQKKFDPQNKYIKKWVPEYGTSEYPKPMIDHEEARRRAMMMYRDSRGVK